MNMKEEFPFPQGTWHIKCLGKDGKLKWEEKFSNIVVNEGRTEVLQKFFKGVAYTAAWFMGFKSALGGQVGGDTLASHGGWAEVNPQGANRVALAFNDAAGQSIGTGQFNVSITLAGPTNVGGAFVCSVQTGAGGKLYSVGDFSQVRAVSAGDVLQLSQTFGA
jgi:hypothetical protein